MRSWSSLGVGLSLVFGCLLMALVAEIYYLFWWRKKRTADRGDQEGGEGTGAPGELFFFCWGKKPSLLRSRARIPQEHCSTVRTAEDGEDAQRHAFAGGEDGLDVELMELRNLQGPARFLFTIKEETKEDMDSEDGRSRGEESRKGSGRSMSDVLLLSAETPFFTPLSSPPFFTPPLTPMGGCCSPLGFNPLSEHSEEDDRRRIGLGSSPPPKFKFLKDAEEKLYRKTLMEEAMRVHRVLAEEAPSSLASAAAAGGASPSSTRVGCSAEEEGSFITIVIGRSQERGGGRHQHHSSSSQVIPLPSSPLKC